jgi:hypothetical protein
MSDRKRARIDRLKEDFPVTVALPEQPKTERPMPDVTRLHKWSDDDVQYWARYIISIFAGVKRRVDAGVRPEPVEPTDDRPALMRTAARHDLAWLMEILREAGRRRLITTNELLEVGGVEVR